MLVKGASALEVLIPINAMFADALRISQLNSKLSVSPFLWRGQAGNKYKCRFPALYSGKSQNR